MYERCGVQPISDCPKAGRTKNKAQPDNVIPPPSSRASAANSPYQPAMLEALAYRKYKKHKMDKKLREANAKEALDPQDEDFIRRSMDTVASGTKSLQGSAGSLFKRLGLGKKSSSSGEEALMPTEEDVVAVTDPEGTTMHI